MKRYLYLSLLLFLCISNSKLWAQIDDKLAEKYYRLGEELYNRADFEEALNQFNKSYSHSKRPALLYNMARCLESLGRHEEAIAHYEKFLASNIKNPEVIQSRIANLKRLVEKKKESTSKKPDPVLIGKKTKKPEEVKSKPQKTIEPLPKKESPVTKIVESPPKNNLNNPPIKVPPPTDQPSGSALKTVGWIATITGGLALVAGGVLLVAAKGEESSLEDANASGKDFSDVAGSESTGRALNTGGIISLISGGIILTGGIVSLILDGNNQPASKKHEKQSSWLHFSPLPGGVVVQSGFHF